MKAVEEKRETIRTIFEGQGASTSLLTEPPNISVNPSPGKPQSNQRCDQLLLRAMTTEKVRLRIGGARVARPSVDTDVRILFKL